MDVRRSPIPVSHADSRELDSPQISDQSTEHDDSVGIFEFRDVIPVPPSNTLPGKPVLKRASSLPTSASQTPFTESKVADVTRLKSSVSFNEIHEVHLVRPFKNNIHLQEGIDYSPEIHDEWIGDHFERSEFKATGEDAPEMQSRGVEKDSDNPLRKTLAAKQKYENLALESVATPELATAYEEVVTALSHQGEMRSLMNACDALKKNIANKLVPISREQEKRIQHARLVHHDEGRYNAERVETWDDEELDQNAAVLAKSDRLNDQTKTLAATANNAAMRVVQNRINTAKAIKENNSTEVSRLSSLFKKAAVVRDLRIEAALAVQRNDIPLANALIEVSNIHEKASFGGEAIERTPDDAKKMREAGNLLLDAAQASKAGDTVKAQRFMKASDEILNPPSSCVIM